MTSERSERGHPVAVCGAIKNGAWWVVVTHFTFILHENHNKPKVDRNKGATHLAQT